MLDHAMLRYYESDPIKNVFWTIKPDLSPALLQSRKAMNRSKARWQKKAAEKARKARLVA